MPLPVWEARVSLSTKVKLALPLSEPQCAPTVTRPCASMAAKLPVFADCYSVRSDLELLLTAEVPKCRRVASHDSGSSVLRWSVDIMQLLEWNRTMCAEALRRKVMVQQESYLRVFLSG
jgi:hypothetical protein